MVPESILGQGNVDTVCSILSLGLGDCDTVIVSNFDNTSAVVPYFWIRIRYLYSYVERFPKKHLLISSPFNRESDIFTGVYIRRYNAKDATKSVEMPEQYSKNII